MKRKILSTLKIYLITILYVVIISFIYSFYIMKTSNNSNVYIELLIGSSSFLLLGLLYGNAIHKKGIWVGLIVGLLHILLIHFVYFLISGSFNLKILPAIIYTICSGIGGILGVNFKKII